MSRFRSDPQALPFWQPAGHGYSSFSIASRRPDLRIFLRGRPIHVGAGAFLCRRGIDLHQRRLVGLWNRLALLNRAVTSISNSTTYGRSPVERIIGAAATTHTSPGKPEVGWLTVDEESAGQRLDNFLIRHLKGVPKTHVYRIIRSGEVRVNKGRAGADTRVSAGDVVRVPPVRVAERPAAGAVPGREFPVLLEDEQLLAIDKPAGVAVHRGPGGAHQAEGGGPGPGRLPARAGAAVRRPALAACS